MSEPDKKTIALAELELLQSIIARQDEFKEKTKTMAITLLSAVSVGFFSGQITLSPWLYFLSCLGICLTFMILEGAYGTTEINAERRVQEVETFLRNVSQTEFLSPDISGAMLRPTEIKSLFSSMMRARTLFLYVILIALSGGAAVFVSPSQTASEADRKLLIEVTQVRKQVEELKTSTSNIGLATSELDKRLTSTSETIGSIKSEFEDQTNATSNSLNQIRDSLHRIEVKAKSQP